MLLSLTSLIRSYFNNAKPSELKDLGCTKTNNNERDSKGHCSFCGVTAEKGFNVIWEDETFIAFHDRNPACSVHIQLIPREHIESVRELTKSDIELVKSMSAVGHRILDELFTSLDTSSRRLGFHIPPFNSVQHLHMHIQVLPYKNWFRAKKYPVLAWGAWYTAKRLSWFITVEQAIEILGHDRRIKVVPR